MHNTGSKCIIDTHFKQMPTHEQLGCSAAASSAQGLTPLEIGSKRAVRAWGEAEKRGWFPLCCIWRYGLVQGEAVLDGRTLRSSFRLAAVLLQ
jgi:hypothetical protein